MSDQWNISREQRKGLAQKLEKAVLVGLVRWNQTKEQVDEYLDELEFLASTAGAVTEKKFVQRMKHPDVKTFVGKGKVEEIQEYVEEHEIDLVIFDDDLTAKQNGILEKLMKVKIVDRSSLILDIFASRAQTAQAKTQVELAQMQYLLPRLRGLWTHLERQRGGIGMRGPGEQEIETDRRIVRDKISLLKKRLDKIDQQNKTQRKNRGAMIRVALVGYTNVGKSTLMNLLSKSEVFAEDKLFATLDTTVRKVVWERMPFLLSDTVGFIRKLPHHLVESFKSTLDEVRESDILVHVVDFAHPQYEDHIKTVEETLKDLECQEKKQILVFNKIDSFKENTFDELLDQESRDEILEVVKQKIKSSYDQQVIFVSAKTKENVETLRSVLKDLIEKEYELRYPYQTRYW